MTITGYQIVLLDECGAELRRIPDEYEGWADFVLDAYRYDLVKTMRVHGQQVRYFARTSKEHHERTRRRPHPDTRGRH